MIMGRVSPVSLLTYGNPRLKKNIVIYMEVNSKVTLSTLLSSRNQIPHTLIISGNTKEGTGSVLRVDKTSMSMKILYEPVYYKYSSKSFPVG